jgi:hypothetical protein
MRLAPLGAAPSLVGALAEPSPASQALATVDLAQQRQQLRELWVISL